VSIVVFDGAEDVLGDGGGNGEVSALGLVSVLIGDVLDLEALAVGGGVGVRALGDDGVFEALGLGLPQLTVLLSADSVLGLVTAGEEMVHEFST